MDKELQEITMQLIVNSGEAKSLAMEAINCAKKEDIEEAYAKIKEAKEILVRAHQYQTDLSHREASCEKFNINIPLIHSQDHLTTSSSCLLLAEEIVELHKQIQKR